MKSENVFYYNFFLKRLKPIDESSYIKWAYGILI